MRAKKFALYYRNRKKLMPLSDELSRLLEQLINGFTVGSFYALIALGYTMVYGVLTMINFAHGDIFMVGSYWGLFAISQMGKIGLLETNPVLAIVIAFVIGMLGAALTGIIVERFAYRPLRKAGRLAPLISAIGTSIILQEITRLLPTIGKAVLSLRIGSHLVFPESFTVKVMEQLSLFGGVAVKTYPAVLGTDGFIISGIFISYSRLLIVFLSLTIMIVLYLMVRYLKIGFAMRAVSEDKDTAMLMGVDVNRTISTTFFIGSALAGIAGVMVGLFYLQIRVDMGFVPGIKAFTAAVLGGIGSIPGAMIGGYLLGLVETLSIQVLPAVYKDVVAFVVLILTLTFMPNGLLGRRKFHKKL
jgi:branched-chain amino acid transport system permease protein